MEQKLKITYYKPDRQGVFSCANGYLFATEAESDKECGVLLYSQTGEEMRIPFSKTGRRGTLYGVRIENNEGEFPFTKYNYYEGETVYTDPYAKLVDGLQVWGDFDKTPRPTFGLLTDMSFDWEQDEAPEIPLYDTFIYGLNVRAFTMHKSSGVKNKGTFEGITQKISHFQKLGVTAIELMPAYEYEECMKNERKQESRVNCWGFQNGFYFAPKASYASQRADISFKEMVKALHKNGLEVWMHFYFPPECKPSYITEVLRYWSMEYHVDGFRLNGFQIPLTFIAQDAILKRCKIRNAYIPADDIYDKPPVYRNMLSDNGNFRNDMRRFLKGDENLIQQVMHYHRNNSVFCGMVNILADYDGFSLYDLVSYEKKHNEANGENNRDGAEANYSWNCGAEGESRKKSVIELRNRQLKNALAFLFLSQGVPYLFSGDEFANTRCGNNNAYCQDNETGFVKWKLNRFSQDILSFVCEMSRLRKAHEILHFEKELQVMDTIACGYPDISYHGTEAWRPDTSYISRMIGIMLYGEYAHNKKEESLYIAYNMHWEPHELALPKLPKGKEWCLLFTTAAETNADAMEENRVLVYGRSVALYASRTNASVAAKRQKKAKKDIK